MAGKRKFASITECDPIDWHSSFYNDELSPSQNPESTESHGQHENRASVQSEGIPPSIRDHALVDPGLEDLDDDLSPETVDFVYEESVEFDDESGDSEDEDEIAVGQGHRCFEPRELLGVTRVPGHTERVSIFDKRMFNIVRLLVEEATKNMEDKPTHKRWLNVAFIRPINKSSASGIFHIFQQLVPESTRAALGHDQLTGDHLLSLPEVNDTCRGTSGVYLNCARKYRLRQPELESIPMRVASPTGTDCVYVGSTTFDVHERVRHQMYDIEHKTTGKRPFHHQAIQQDELESNFRVVALFPENIPYIEVPCPEVGWLVRLLETVIMILVDAYMIPDRDSFRVRYGVEKEEYLNALKECGIPQNNMRSLNKALPTKQSVRGTISTRQCRNCKASQSIAWYYDRIACNVAIVYLCQACYLYRYRVGCDRPSFLFGRQSPKHGPCSNCEVVVSSRWRWHMAIPDRIVCNNCYHWRWKHGEERPRELWIKRLDGKFCLKCGRTDSSTWAVIRNAEGELTGEYRCRTCSKLLRDKEDRLARRLGCYRCYKCGTTDSAVWPTPRACQRCYDNKTMDNDLKDERDRSTCLNCDVGFSKQNRKAWCPILQQWLCNACARCITDQRCYRVTPRHVEGLEIRCEACKVLSARRWRLETNDPLGNASYGRVICGRCFFRWKRRRKNLIENPDRMNYQPRAGDVTFQDWLRARRKLTRNSALAEYLQRVHGKVMKIDDIPELTTRLLVLRLWEEGTNGENSEDDIEKCALGDGHLVD